jgi:hypothetical protein
MTGSPVLTWQGTGLFEVRQVPNGGANDCDQATPILGVGYFGWNTAGPTTDGPSNCAPIFRDLWVAWTAPTTDSYRFTMCGKTTLDTVRALHDGTSCPPGASIPRDDNACGQQSELTAVVTLGNSYLIQIGAAVDGEVGSGNLGIFEDTCSPIIHDDANSDNRHSMLVFVSRRRKFHCWFRDPVAGGAFFNTSNAISLQIQP